jgi:hypothetical protein
LWVQGDDSDLAGLDQGGEDSTSFVVAVIAVIGVVGRGGYGLQDAHYAQRHHYRQRHEEDRHSCTQHQFSLVLLSKERQVQRKFRLLHNGVKYEGMQGLRIPQMGYS